MKTVISGEEDTRRVTATYPLKRDATKKTTAPYSFNVVPK
jgi:hypothetical protein